MWALSILAGIFSIIFVFGLILGFIFLLRFIKSRKLKWLMIVMIVIFGGTSSWWFLFSRWSSSPPKTAEAAKEVTQKPVIIVELKGPDKPAIVELDTLRKKLKPGESVRFEGPPDAKIQLVASGKKKPAVMREGNILTLFKNLPSQVNQIHFLGPKGQEVKIFTKKPLTQR